MDMLKTLAKQPYWVITLFLGTALVAAPCVTIDKDFHCATHQPGTYWLFWIGFAMLLLSFSGFSFTLLSPTAKTATDAGTGLDLTSVKERNGEVWTVVGGCEIRVAYGRIENCATESEAVIVLPCNEYFDDLCVADPKTALGAYVSRVFDGQAKEFDLLVQEECRKRLGAGVEQQKKDDERALSFGTGRCLLLKKPLGRSVQVALISTTTQRASQGLAARISYLFDGMRELFERLADARSNEITMPLLGGGKGRIDPPLALVGLLLAVAEAARYGQGGQRPKRVTIVVFKRDEDSPPEVDPVVVRRALALIGSQG